MGLWIMSIPKGEISTVDPAIATTDAAEAAIPSILTATFPLEHIVNLRRRITVATR